MTAPGITDRTACRRQKGVSQPIVAGITRRYLPEHSRPAVALRETTIGRRDWRTSIRPWRTAASAIMLLFTSRAPKERASILSSVVDVAVSDFMGAARAFWIPRNSALSGIKTLCSGAADLPRARVATNVVVGDGDIPRPAQHRSVPRDDGGSPRGNNPADDNLRKLLIRHHTDVARARLTWTPRMVAPRSSHLFKPA